MGLVVPPGQVGESCSPLAGALPAPLPYPGRMSLAGFQGLRLKLPGGDRVPGCHGEAANSPAWKNRDPVSAGLFSREPKSFTSPYKDEASLPLFRLFPFVYMINILASPPPSPPSGSGTQGGWGWKPKGVEGWRGGGREWVIPGLDPWQDRGSAATTPFVCHGWPVQSPGGDEQGCWKWGW